MNTNYKQTLLTLIEECGADELDEILKIVEPYIAFKNSINTSEVDKIHEQMSRFANLTKSVLGRFSYAVIVNSFNGILAVHPEDCMVGYSLRFEGSYGLTEINRIKNIAREDDSLLIVGSHVGALVIPCCKFTTQVTAIEANPDSFQLLELNLALNDIDNCVAINIAASDKKEYIPFLLNRVNSGGSKRKPLHNNDMYTYDHPELIEVAGDTLDNVLPQGKFDIIVMDLEGSEYFALKGMFKLLQTARVLIIEFVPHHLKNVSGISIEDFLRPLNEFDKLYIPSMDKSFSFDTANEILQFMFDHDISDDGIIFEKSTLK